MGVGQVLFILLVLCEWLVISSDALRISKPPIGGKAGVHKSDIHGFSFTPLESFHLIPHQKRGVNEPVTPANVDHLLLGTLYYYIDEFTQLEPLSANAFADGRHALSLVNSAIDPHLGEAVHYSFKQVYRGIPVWGSFVKVHTRSHQHTIRHINGVFLPEHTLQNASNSVPKITKEDAEAIALKTASAVIDTFRTSRHHVITSSLTLYHHGLTRNQHADVILAYQVVVGPVAQNTSLYYVFVDAIDGSIRNQFSNRQSVLSREVWQTQYRARSPVYTEGGTLPNDLDAQNIIKYSGDVYTLFKNMLNRESYNGKAAKMIGVYNIPSNDPNLGCPIQAFWDGVSINFCATMARTDVTVHEWTHAYTEYTHALIYQYQSGALNEAYSDIVAESLQNIFGIPTTYPPRPNINECGTISGTSTKRWLVGDELTQFAQFFPEGLRDMYNPNCQGNPRYTQDPFVLIGSADNGGVHINSGIANQGFSILSDGGTLNGVAVRGIGVVKALAIYLRAMAVYQGPTTNFAGHSIALAKSCNDLIGESLPDPKTGAKSNVVISDNDCAQVGNAMQATMMEQDLPTSSSAPPLPIIINGFPKVGPVSTPGSSPTLFVLASPNLVSNTVYCGFSRDGNTIANTVMGNVLSTESFTSAVCPLPTSWTAPDDDCFVTISADGRNFANTGLRFSVYADPVVTSISPTYIPEEGGIVTIKGTGFKEYTGCTITVVPDSNGGKPDCLTCIFGSFESDHPVAAVFVDSTTVTCQVPARSNLTNSYINLAALFSMNNQVFYPLPDISFAVTSPIGMGGTMATILVPLIIAVIVIGIILLAFHGMSPSFLKPVDEQLKGLIQSDDGTERGAYIFKYLRAAPITLVLVTLEFIWIVVLAATTHTVFSIYVVVVCVFTFASVLFCLFIIRNHKNNFLLIGQLFVFTCIVLMLIGFALMCVLVSQFRTTARVSGTSQDAQIVLLVPTIILHVLVVGFQVLLVKYAHVIYKEYTTKGMINISDVDAQSYEDNHERDLSHVNYMDAP